VSKITPRFARAAAANADSSRATSRTSAKTRSPRQSQSGPNSNNNLPVSCKFRRSSVSRSAMDNSGKHSAKLRSAMRRGLLAGIRHSSQPHNAPTPWARGNGSSAANCNRPRKKIRRFMTLVEFP